MTPNPWRHLFLCTLATPQRTLCPVFAGRATHLDVHDPFCVGGACDGAVVEPEPSDWTDYWARVGSEELLTAKALLDLCPSPLRSEALVWLRVDVRQDGSRWSYLDWDAWFADYDEKGRGWSSTERNLAEVVFALVDRERKVSLPSVLGYLGSWETEVWRILTEWGTGGNNREHPGRATVVRR